jgi:cytochrome c oxidase subunit 2
MKHTSGKLITYLGTALLAFSAVQAQADELNMPVGVTAISREVYDLHMLITWICVVIGVGVFGVMFYSIWKHRRSVGHEAAQFHESTRLEITWTIIPFVILVGMAVPATNVLIDMYDTGGEDMTIEIRGYQWKWQYKYLDEDFNNSFSFLSTLSTTQDQIQNRAEKGEHYLLEVDEPMRIPANRKVRFLLTSEDVIHAWWIPDFGIKRDAVPGILNELWTIVEEPGTYRGQCTELCGKDHGFMPIVVEVLPEDEYDAWHASRVEAEAARQASLGRSFTTDELMATGEEVYGKFCVACHMANGQGVPPVFPSLVGTEVVSGDRDAHIELVLNGKPGTAMQAFSGQLDAAQIAAVVHYERHAWGNNAGDVTQPGDVIRLQEGQ